jgi:hypothetical protein
MAWHFKILQVDPLKDETDEVTIPGGWEPFQVDRSGAAGWTLCLRLDDGVPLGDKPGV